MVMMEDFYAAKDGDMVSVIAGVSNLIRPCIKFETPRIYHPYLYLPPSQGEEV